MNPRDQSETRYPPPGVESSTPPHGSSPCPTTKTGVLTGWVSRTLKFSFIFYFFSGVVEWRSWGDLLRTLSVQRTAIAPLPD